MILCLPMESEPFRAQIVDTRHVWYFWSLHYPRQMSHSSRRGKTCTVTNTEAGSKDKQSKAYEPCLYRPLNQDFIHILLFVFRCKTRLMTRVPVRSRVCEKKTKQLQQTAGWILLWVCSDDYIVEKKNPKHVMSAVSHHFRVSSDLIIVQCLTRIRSSRSESGWRYFVFFVCFIFRH